MREIILGIISFARIVFHARHSDSISGKRIGKISTCANIWAFWGRYFQPLLFPLLLPSLFTLVDIAFATILVFFFFFFNSYPGNLLRCSVSDCFIIVSEIAI